MKLALPVTLLTTSAALAQQYTITDLGSIAPGGESLGAALNASGQIAGFAQVDVQRRYDHAVRTEASGQTVDLGVISGGRVSYGWGINDSGQVAGTSEKLSG